MFFFDFECTLRHDVFLVVCQVFCAKMVRTTLSDGYVVSKNLENEICEFSLCTVDFTVLQLGNY